ncbi:hypothetical protein GALMADRAFT_63659 [Galerina marginata CBS 339.88]|uniref:PBP domain-containing protein n=1 Tax=Galerina marginata (strain CBS 339.88) TaxID=685588 RepID=A0A067THK0_GALM3|nr:hypothetical protein GALMADRAFT_63659 [Galerina marginata CBS 339.88]
MLLFKFLARLFHKKDQVSDREDIPEGSNSPHDTLVFDDIKGALDSFHPDSRKSNPSSPQSKPHAIYDGGYEHSGRGVCLRIANGGAGQTGLIQAWADSFIQYMVVTKGLEPFQVAWYLGDTTESLAFLASGVVDVALTYNSAAETQLLHSGDATERVYAFRDHFLLVGPKCNPAKLTNDDDILTMFNKIVSSGNADIVCPPDQRPPTRFLSRFDKSATNIKESLIFATVGQVPWALNYSKWYHQYPRFPREALQTASLLSEYTLTDKGSWLDAPKSITSSLEVFKLGSDNSDDLLLNPAHLLCGKRASPEHKSIWKEFMSWVVAPDGGERIIESFSKKGQVLYSKAP